MILLNKSRKLLLLTQGVVNYNLLHHFKPLAPTELQINVTYQCNSRCRMCHIWQMKPINEMSLSEWQTILKDPIFRGIERLLIAGGEPTLHPQLRKLTELFLDSMPKLASFNLVTNGFLTERVVAAVKDLAILSNKRKLDFSVSVSLDGVGEMHETMRRIPEAFKKTSTTILKLKDLQKKDHFGLSAGGVISHLNLEEIEKVEKWCRQMDVPFNYQIIGFHQTFVDNLSEKNKLDFTSEDQEKLSALLHNLAGRKSIRDPRSFLRSYYWQDMLSLYHGGLRTTPCPFVLDAFVLDSFGDVYYCLSEPKIGNCRPVSCHPEQSEGSHGISRQKRDPATAGLRLMPQNDNERKDHSVSQIYYDPKNLRLRQQRAKTVCLKCNSGCFVSSGIAKDFKKAAWYFVTGRLGPDGVY